LTIAFLVGESAKVDDVVALYRAATAAVRVVSATSAGLERR